MESIVIENISKYTLEFTNDNLVLKPKNIEITKEELLKNDFKGSKIISAKIKKNNILISDKLKYRSILTDIWKTMDVESILDTTTFNVKTDKDNENGYTWIEELGISFQSRDAKSTFKEILNQIEVNGLKIEIDILLSNGETLKYKNIKHLSFEEVKPYFLKMRNSMEITNQTFNIKNKIGNVSTEILEEIGLDKNEFEYWFSKIKSWFEVLDLDISCFFQIDHFEKSKKLFNVLSLKGFLLDCLEKEVLPIDFEDYLLMLGITIEELWERCKI